MFKTISRALTRRLGRVPALRRLKRATRSVVSRRGLSMLGQIDVFAPNSTGAVDQRLQLALIDANRSFSVVRDIHYELGGYRIPIIASENFPESDDERRASAALKERLDFHGSDKANDHNYHHVYGSILSRLGDVLSLLEVGLGTNNPDVVSSMGVAGRPGASVRAFRDSCPHADVYGADIDRRILFTEERIKTFYVDQLDLESFAGISEALSSKLDLVIDDGLHTPSANLSVLLFGLRHVRPGGWIVIEDIPPAATPVWQAVGAMLGQGYRPELVEAHRGNMFVIQMPS